MENSVETPGMEGTAFRVIFDESYWSRLQKPPILSNKYEGQRPFKKGEKYGLGKYIGFTNIQGGDYFVFDSGQRTPDAHIVANFLSVYEQEQIEELLGISKQTSNFDTNET